MNRKHAISLIICIILVVCPLSLSALSISSRKTADWSDGTFEGVWSKLNENTTGSIWGTLNQGRRPNHGTFSAEWNTTDEVGTGTFHGIFYGILIIGKWENLVAGETNRITGFLRINDTHFSARLISPKTGLLEISGVHEESFLPKPTGSYSIGIKTLHLIDTNRSENFTTDPTDYREIMIQLWYPIDTINLGTRAEYMDYQTFQWLKNRSPIPLVTIPNNAYTFVNPHIYNDTNIAQGIFPLVIFSPGYDGVYQIYSSFIEDLVSHGFVVASINHPYVSGITVFPDGRTIGLAEVPADPVERAEFFKMSMRAIVDDAKFVLDTLTQMNATDPDFLGHFDLSKIGMYGHSFGGANTATCCFEDSRFCAGLTLDGVFYQEFIPGNISVPFLYMFAEARLSNDSTIMYMWNHTTNDTFKMNITGSTHYAFTDVGVLLSHLVPLIPPRFLLFGTIEPKRMVNITKTYVTTFFQIYLKGEPLETLLNLSDQFDEVKIDYKLG